MWVPQHPLPRLSAEGPQTLPHVLSQGMRLEEGSAGEEEHAQGSRTCPEHTSPVSRSPCPGHLRAHDSPIPAPRTQSLQQKPRKPGQSSSSEMRQESAVSRQRDASGMPAGTARPAGNEEQSVPSAPVGPGKPAGLSPAFLLTEEPPVSVLAEHPELRRDGRGIGV